MPVAVTPRAPRSIWDMTSPPSTAPAAMPRYTAEVFSDRTSGPAPGAVSISRCDWVAKVFSERGLTRHLSRQTSNMKT